jgi:uncharacterized protein DUF2325
MASAEPFDQDSVALFRTLAGLPEGCPARRGRRKLWSLEQKYHCPVIGTCLPMEAVRRIALSHGLSKPRDGDYHAHVSVVGCCESRNPVSLALQHELDRRHRLWVSRMERLREDEDVAAAWREAVDGGEAAGALWALLTCRAASDALRQQAFQDIHMLSHQVGAGTRADLKALAEERQGLAELRASAAAERVRLEGALAERDAQIAGLRRDLATRQAEAAALQATLDAVRPATLEATLARAQLRLAELEQVAARLAAVEAQAARLGGDNANLRFLLRQAEEERDTLERYVLEQAGPAPCADPGACPSLTGRRLLCVGGRCNLTSQYRHLVERSGGEFVWHDGGRDEGLLRLQELLHGADAVICPADCVSHPAYYQIKRHCKRNEKPCVLLRNSGLASFAAGIARLSRGEVEIGAARETD